MLVVQYRGVFTLGVTESLEELRGAHCSLYIIQALYSLYFFHFHPISAINIYSSSSLFLIVFNYPLSTHYHNNGMRAKSIMAPTQNSRLDNLEEMCKHCGLQSLNSKLHRFTNMTHYFKETQLKFVVEQ